MTMKHHSNAASAATTTAAVPTTTTTATTAHSSPSNNESHHHAFAAAGSRATSRNRKSLFPCHPGPIILVACACFVLTLQQNIILRRSSAHHTFSPNTTVRSTHTNTNANANSANANPPPETQQTSTPQAYDVTVSRMAFKTTTTTTLVEDDTPTEQEQQTSRAEPPHEGFNHIVTKMLQLSLELDPSPQPVERPTSSFNHLRTSWKNRRPHHSSSAGTRLLDTDRALLAKIYRNATSVFEFGVGESTILAHQVGVMRYTGVDSNPALLTNVRRAILNSQFRFYLADKRGHDPVAKAQPPTTGSTSFRWPLQTIWNYQLAPLLSEWQPFQVYMINTTATRRHHLIQGDDDDDDDDRLPCLLAAFLHASEHGAPHSQTLVVVPECDQTFGLLAAADPWFHVVKPPSPPPPSSHKEPGQTGKLCVYHRKPSTTNADLVNLWMNTVLRINNKNNNS
ncbi:hypothetical protein ACA910_019564 [Epithemia clementina (nom. ined.)]